MKPLFTTTALLAALVAMPGWAQTSAPTTGGTAATAADSQQLSAQDQGFAKNAAIGGMAEIELGKFAQQKGQDSAVKDFGKHMVDDHSKANEKLATVAKGLKLTLPIALDAKNKQTVDRLAKLSGAEFDRAYIDDMVKDHQEDIAEFQKQASAGQNAQIVDFATTTLPTLQQHLKMAQDAQSKLRSTNAPVAGNPNGAAGRTGSAGTGAEPGGAGTGR